MLESRVLAGSIPTRLYDPGGAHGLLLLGHGGGDLGKDSERFVDLCRRHALGTGLVVACIDAIDHGERRPSGPLEPGVPAGWHSRTAPQMVADWKEASSALEEYGPPLAYVGVSMGSIFGFPAVAALGSIRAAVFMVGGIPEGEWLDDPALGPIILGGAERLTTPEVLMLNMSRDELFPVSGTIAVFNAIPGSRKRLVFRDGTHSHWPIDAIGESITFIVGALSSPSGTQSDETA